MIQGRVRQRAGEYANQEFTVKSLSFKKPLKSFGVKIQASSELLHPAIKRQLGREFNRERRRPS